MSEEQTTTGAAWAVAIISMVGNGLQWLFGWLNARDKLRFDAELGALRTQNMQQAEQIASLKTSHDACDKAHEATKLELAEQRRVTEKRLAEIERALESKKDRTDEKPPLKG